MRQRKHVVLLAFGALGLAYLFLIPVLVDAFTGPTTSAGVGGGAVRTDSSGNLSVGITAPSANTKFLIQAPDTSASNYSLRILQPDGASPLLIVRNDGKIGIGTQATSTSLAVGGDVYLSGSLTATTISGSVTGTVSAGNVSSGVFGSNTGFGNFTFGTSTNPILHIDNTNARVGIGTTAPTARLHVLSSVQRVLNVDSLTGSPYVAWKENGSDFFYIGKADAVSGLGTGYDLYNSVAGQPLSLFSADAGGYFRIFTGGAASGNERLRITATGNVGIGTVNPGQKLEVVGNVSSTAVCLGGTCNSTWPSGGLTGSGTATRVSFWNSASALSSDSNLYWDNTNKRLGVGTATPSVSVHTTGQIRSSVAGGTAPLVVDSTTKVANLNADLLDGLDSSAFGDATAANQTTILSRIGTPTDGAGMDSTLFGGLQYLWDNRAYFTDQYVYRKCTIEGCTATATCPSGFTIAKAHGSDTASISPNTNANCIGQTLCSYTDSNDGASDAYMLILCTKNLTIQ